jgi:hypothetical protein
MLWSNLSKATEAVGKLRTDESPGRIRQSIDDVQVHEGPMETTLA